jgi:hypothetical protein
MQHAVIWLFLLVHYRRQVVMASVKGMYHCIDALVAMIIQGCSKPATHMEMCGLVGFMEP